MSLIGKHWNKKHENRQEVLQQSQWKFQELQTLGALQK